MLPVVAEMAPTLETTLPETATEPPVRAPETVQEPAGARRLPAEVVIFPVAETPPAVAAKAVPVIEPALAVMLPAEVTRLPDAAKEARVPTPAEEMPYAAFTVVERHVKSPRLVIP
jgi:hypothetical protein